jgi:hypothetical protein
MAQTAAEITRGAAGRFQRGDGQPGRKAAKAAATTAPFSLGDLARRVMGKTAAAPRPAAKDVNLPDEQKGQTVATEDTYDTVDNGGTPRPFLTSRHEIKGGSPEDPRWKEFNRRKTLQGAAERATAPRLGGR